MDETHPVWNVRKKPLVASESDLAAFYRDEAIKNLRTNGVDDFLISFVEKAFEDAISAAFEAGKYD